MDFFERLEPIQKRWDVLRHPFYRRWERGELTGDELAYYAASVGLPGNRRVNQNESTARNATASIDICSASSCALP